MASVWELFSNPVAISETIRSAGPLGPAAFIGLQFVQVLVAPIPGQILIVAGGFAFGWAWGSIYSMVGAASGAFVLTTASSKYGRRIASRFVEQERLRKYESVVQVRGRGYIFWAFLLPFFPDDIILVAASLGGIPRARLMEMYLVGKTPGIVVYSILGHGMFSENSAVYWLTFSGIIIVCTVAYFWIRKRTSIP